MTSPRTLARIEALAWVLIYGGLFTLILGIASHGRTAVGGWSLSVLGIAAAIAGVVLILVRSRLRPSAPDDAQSQDDPRRPAA